VVANLSLIVAELGAAKAVLALESRTNAQRIWTKKLLRFIPILSFN